MFQKLIAVLQTKILFEPQFSPSLPVTLNPLIESKRGVVGIHAEAVDHLTRDIRLFIMMGEKSLRFPRFRYESVDKHLVICIVDMAVEHERRRLSFRVQCVLLVVAEYRIVHEADLLLVVVEFRIIPHPTES